MLAAKEEAKNKAITQKREAERRAAEAKKAAKRRAEAEKRAAKRSAEEARRAAEQAKREDVASKVKTRGVAALSTQDIVVILEQEQVSCVGNVGQDARVGRRQRREHLMVLVYRGMVWCVCVYVCVLLLLCVWHS